MKRIFFTLIFLISFLCAFAFGEWEIFSSNGQYGQMAAFGDRLYVTCGNSVFWADPSTGDKGSITTAHGMHGSNVAFLLSNNDYLVIVYRDGLVDLMSSDGHFYDIPDFQNKIIAGDRTINQAKICGDELYLACAFGVVQFDLLSQSIQFSYPTASPCKFAFSFGDYLYHYTQEEGLKRINKNHNYLIASQWETAYDSQLYDAAVFTDSEGRERCWISPVSKAIQEIDSLGNFTNLNLWNNQLLYPSGPYVFGSGWGVQIARTSDNTMTYLHKGPFNSCRGYYAANDTIVYTLNATLGIQKISISYQPSADGSYTLLDDELGYSLNYQEWLGSKCGDLEIDAGGALITFNGDKIFMGGFTSMTVTPSIINTYYDGEWSYILEDSVLEWMRDYGDDPAIINASYYRGLTDLAAHPTEPGHFFVGTLTHGMYEFADGHTVAHYDAQDTPNGPLPTTYSENNTRVTALAFDTEDNLWSGYSYAQCALAVMTPDGQWIRHPIRGNNELNNVGRIIPTRFGEYPLVWLVQNYGYQKCSVSILYNAGGATDASMDQSVTFSTLVDQDNNLIELNNIYDLCEDHNGNIWILTSNGPFRVEDPAATYNYAEKNGRGLVRRVKIPRNDGTNLADYLMVSTSCTCMVIDNYNRKWIGTNGDGLYLLSDDCVTEIEHFTTANSLLPSDEIIALAYDGNENRLYISTEAGLSAYSTDDLAGNTDYDQMHCFPNPVRPEYNGELRIMGLMDDSQVSITDASGNLFFTTHTQGSTVTWDLRDSDGRRINPGIYLIHGISSDARKGQIIKVLVL